MYFFINKIKLSFLVLLSIPSNIYLPFPLIFITSCICTNFDILNSFLLFKKTLPSSITSLALVLDNPAISDIILSNLKEDTIIFLSSNLISGFSNKS